METISPRSSLEEQLHQGQLYFQAGAVEFRLCDELGAMRFSDAAGPLDRSRLCPQFPLRATLRG